MSHLLGKSPRADRGKRPLAHRWGGGKYRHISLKSDSILSNELFASSELTSTGSSRDAP
jgi:hypothetical protein